MTVADMANSLEESGRLKIVDPVSPELRRRYSPRVSPAGQGL